MAFRGIQAHMVKFQGFNGDTGEAYYARASAAGKYPGVIVIHHFPGWDEWTTEVVRKFAHHAMRQFRQVSTFGSVTELQMKSWRAHAQQAGCRTIR